MQYITRIISEKSSICSVGFGRKEGFITSIKREIVLIFVGRWCEKPMVVHHSQLITAGPIWPILFFVGYLILSGERILKKGGTIFNNLKIKYNWLDNVSC